MNLALSLVGLEDLDVPAYFSWEDELLRDDPSEERSLVPNIGGY